MQTFLGKRSFTDRINCQGLCRPGFQINSRNFEERNSKNTWNPKNMDGLSGGCTSPQFFFIPPETFVFALPCKSASNKYYQYIANKIKTGCQLPKQTEALAPPRHFISPQTKI